MSGIIPRITKKVRPKVAGQTQPQTQTRRQRPKSNKPILFDKANDQHSQILIDWFKTHTEIIENLESYKDTKTGLYDKAELRRKSLKLDNPLKMRIAKDTNIALPLNVPTLNYLFNLYDPDKVFMIPIKGKNRDYNSHTGYYFINNEKGLQGWVLKNTPTNKSKTNVLSSSSEIGSSSSDLSSSSSSNTPKTTSKSTPKPPSPPSPPTTTKTPSQEPPQGPATPGKINLYDPDRAEHAEYTKSHPHTPHFLYPSLNDPHFSQEIAHKKEFTDTRYDGKIHNIEEYADILCNTKFELAPHQLFVKNFLSNDTPYNSLLLFHGLGTGKTCSAIGIAEESRIFMKQIGLTKSIFVVATPNVQQNFRIQLFDPRKLQSENGVWNINACVGNSLLKEINPMNMRGLTKEKAIALIQAIINQYYVFMGYVEFANYIQARIRISADASDTEREKKERALIQQFFNNRLVIIDEVHNIRLTDDNKNKRTTNLLMKVAKYSQNMKLVVLSATPMYNSYTEIVWLLNLLNANDKRATIQIDQVFDADGEFRKGGPPDADPKKGRGKGVKKGKNGAAGGGTPSSTENGRDLLMRKLIGYVSYVRGENPYNFPYRIYPLDFDKTRAIQTVASPPTRQLNGNPIPKESQKRKLPLYTNVVKQDSYQYHVYDKLIHGKKMGNIKNMDSFGYTMLQAPIEALNIVYPDEDFVLDVSETAAAAATDALLPTMIGKAGLDRITTSTVLKSPFIRTNFAYKPEILKKYGRVFHPENIKNYSAKISSICQTVLSSDGIILIYSQYIDGGVVPIALALEEMGFAKYGSPTEGGAPAKSLFKTPPTEPLDALARIPRSRMKPGHIFYPAKYVMITGDITYSPNNAEDIKAITNTSNKDGREIKVVLISKAGSEGLDFKWIRQVHVLEPWYNMNRIEQIIGRGVRNMSHCGIPFIERNVEIYLHCTVFEEGEAGEKQEGSSSVSQTVSSSGSQTKTPVGQTEAVDLYVYRLAEKKAMQIGKITRLLKQTAIDCLLNIEQTNFTEEKLFEELNNQNIRLRLSSQTELLPFKIGDKRESYTDVCDYMDTCDFTCLPNAHEKAAKQPNYMTYNEKFVNTTKEQIVDRIRQLFKERAFYSEKALIQQINVVKKYPLEQIYHTLTYLIGNQNEYLTDKYDRRGYLIEKAGLSMDGKTEIQYYAFQPIEITDVDASVYERTMPVDYKRRSLNLELNPNPEVRPIERQISELTRRDQTGDFRGDAAAEVAVSESADVLQDHSAIANEIYEDMVRCIQTANVSNPSKEMKMDWFYNLKFGDIKPGASAAAQKREKKSLKTLLTKIHGISPEEIDFYAMRHYMDTLTLDKKQVLLSEYLQPTVVSDAASRTSILNQINNYFHERLLVIQSMTAILFANENSYVILKQSKTNPREWSKISPEDKFKLIAPLKKLTVPLKNVNHFVGFMHPFKGSEVVFKVKDTTQKNNKNNKGVKCDIMSKPRIIEKINHVLGEDVYQSRGVQLENIDKIQLCILLEILMRHLTRTDPPNVRFYDAESAILNTVVDM